MSPGLTPSAFDPWWVLEGPRPVSLSRRSWAPRCGALRPPGPWRLLLGSGLAPWMLDNLRLSQLPDRGEEGTLAMLG